MNGLGYVVIARLSHQLAGLQATWTAVGVAAFVGTLLVVRRGRDLQRYRYTLLLAGILLLLLPLSPLGRDVNGARVWISLGPMSFQPGELAKLCLVVFLAGYLVQNRELLGMATWPRFRPMLPDPKHLGPVLVAIGLALAVLVAQNDFGQSLLLVTLFIVMLWVGTVGPGTWWSGSACSRPARTPRCAAPRTSASASTCGCTRGPATARSGRIPDRAGRLRDGVGWDRGDGAGSGLAGAGARVAERLHLRRDRRGARPAGRHRR